MWSVVTWPVRSRPVRRVLLLWLGQLIRRRLRATGAALWSDQQEDDRRRPRWPWVLALAVAGLAAGLLYRWSRQRGPASDGPPPAAAPASGAWAVDPTPTSVVTTPQLGVADLSRAPEQPDLAAGEAMIGRSLAVDDLKVVEGIGPKIEQLLNDRGVRTWHDLSVADVDRLRDILQEAGARYRMHDPSTWPQQATLLARGDWEAFTALNNGDPDA
jgi:predicted flap endonuclease-1-like 5' DNA nuclease